MKTSLTALTAGAVAAVLLGACSTEPARPAAITIVSGDSQAGLAGTALAESLVVAVSGSDGGALPGANITWQVTTGAATLSPATSQSNGAGQAASAVTLAAAGTSTVTATADGVPPVTFHVTAISPCSFRWPFDFNASVTAALSSIDCKYIDGSYIDYYQMTTATQQAVRITLTSASFDAFLFFDTDGGVPVAGNDDDATSTNAEIKIIVAPGSYVVGANSYDPGVVGPYTLVSQPIAADIAACDIWFVTPAVLTSQQLAASDCTSNGFYADLIAVFLEGGRSYTFTTTSTAFDAYLELLDGNGNLITGDDNSAGGTNARISYTPGASDVFILAPQSAVAGATGAYTLTVSAPFPAPPAGLAAAAIRPRSRGTTWLGVRRRYDARLQAPERKHLK